LLIAFAWASPVSLLQETREIECVFAAKEHPKYDRLVIERKDSKIEAFKGKEKVAEFARVKFLDSAILLDGALFQILPNGEAQFTEGKLISFQEKDCEDTGASKTCKTDSFKKLFWSPEKLTMDGQGGALRQYGFFANHATYFLSDGLSLLDYGRELNLLVGPARKVTCKYLD
jgi:hypothetical protein